LLGPPEALLREIEQRYLVAEFAEFDGIAPRSASDVAYRSRFREVRLDQSKGGGELDSR
jgi:hypothetical protein